jgi:dipeptidyl-peptidase-4
VNHGWLVPAALGLAATVCLAEPPPAVTAEDYARAERFVLGNAQQYILNGDVEHHWIADTERLHYRRETSMGHEFTVFDAATAKRRPAFDHAALASALSAATAQPVEARRLPFARLDRLEEGRFVELTLEGRRWRCELQAECAPIAELARPGEVLSPDGRWGILRKGNDVWLRSLADDVERALTTDGTPELSYGGRDWLDHLRGLAPRITEALWSLDSRYVLVERGDTRGVLDMHFVEHVPPKGVRPNLYSVPVAFPGDPNKEHVDAIVIFDVLTGRRVEARHEAFMNGYGPMLQENDVWWSPDAREVYVTPHEVYRKVQRLLSVDAATGAVRTLIEETSPTFVNDGVMLYESNRGPSFLSTGEIIWYSERDDWGHLYLYDRTGRLEGQITKGPWRVRDVVRVDERRRQVYFTANGREPGEDPYQRHLYVVSLDGSGLRLLTPGDADHDVDADEGFSPSGEHFVEIGSRPDLPAVTRVRRRDGHAVATLETADVTALLKGGFTFPEPFEALAADGRTKIYGNLFFPSRFDSSRRYPVVDSIYPGPQRIQTAKSFMRGLGEHSTADQGFAQSLAELGFIVVTVDGRGTPLRSKSFHDVVYGNMQQAGNLEDHVAALKRLAAGRPYMDLERVGIYGHSAGGFAVVRAMAEYPDFFKVGISSAGDHDLRGDDLGFATTFQGPYEGQRWEPLVNARLVHDIRGKLLMIHGDMDQLVSISQALQLVDALIRANKDYELLYVPNAGHDVDRNPYVIRRRWDYFVRHLLGAQPPAGYRIGTPPQ